MTPLRARPVSHASLPPEVERLLLDVVADGFVVYRCGPQTAPTALAASYEWDHYVDLVTIRRFDRITAARVPKREHVDVFAPDTVVWAYEGPAEHTLRALLTLVHPRHPDAPTGEYPAPCSLHVPRHEQRPTTIRLPSAGRSGVRAARLSRPRSPGTPDLTIPAEHHSGVGTLPGGAGGATGGAGHAGPAAATSAPGIQGGAPGAPYGPQPALTEAQGGAAAIGPEYSGAHSPPIAPLPPGGGGTGGIDPYPAGMGPHDSGPAPTRRTGSAGVNGRPASGGIGPRARRTPDSGGIGPERGAGASGSPGYPPARGRGVTGAGQLGTAGAPGAVAPFAGTSGH